MIYFPFKNCTTYKEHFDQLQTLKMTMEDLISNADMEKPQKTSTCENKENI